MLKLHPLPADLRFFHPAVLVGSFFGSGLLRPASGTWGSLAAVLPAIFIAQSFGALGLLIASLITYGLGYVACRIWLANSQDQDPSPIVIDEVAGLFLALSGAPLTLVGVAAAFVLFRLLDIAKPFPISWADKSLKGAHGVMFDDILAGGGAALVLLLAQAYGWL